jgi:hypothetical protein
MIIPPLEVITEELDESSSRAESL